jgi:type IV secretion system protein VirD4
VPQYKLGEGPYGSAYRGTIDDLFGSGDLTPIELGRRSFGLFLGQFDWVQTVRQVWEEPAKGIWAWLTKRLVTREYTENIPQVHDLRFTGDQHHLIVASSGAGKFRDILANMLLYDGSCETASLIIDPKGEIAATIGAMTDAPGARDSRTVLLDPWDLCGTGMTDALTLLDGIRIDNPHCVKDTRVLADAIIIERNADDSHWAATAKNFLAALLLYLGLDPIEKNERTLFRLRQIVTLPWDDLADLLGYLTDSTVFEGLVARAARAMLNRNEKERRAILSTLERDTAFIEDPGLWKAIKSSTFDMNQLVLTNKRLHVIVPFDYTAEMSSWLRLTIAAFYNACLRNQLNPRLPRFLQFRHIIIDEFAGLGKLDFIMKGIAEARGAGIKYHLAVQNFAQLRDLYDEGWENLVSNSFIHAFGVNEVFTAEYLSKMTGQATVVTESRGFSESRTTGTSSTTGSSSTSGHSGSSSGSSSSSTQSSSTTHGTSVTFSSTGRPVLMPDEIRRIPEGHQILFLRQMPAVLTRRTPYYETFQRFLPRHTLRDILISTKLSTGQRALVPYDSRNLGAAGALVEVNSVLRPPSFSPPLYREYTFGEALRQSPGFIVAMIGLICLLLWGIPHEIIIWQEQRAAEAHAQELAIKAAADAAEARRLADIRSAQQQKEAAVREAQAGAIDNQIRAPYATLAGGMFNAIARAGMCTSSGNPSPEFTCSTMANYNPGQLTSINLSVSIRRQQFATLNVAPQNEKRNGSFSGALGTITVQSVFQKVDVDSSDATRFHPALRAVLASMLRAFAVPDGVLETCADMAQGLSQFVNGTNVSCRFVDRPSTIGGMSQLTLTLSRKM